MQQGSKMINVFLAMTTKIVEQAKGRVDVFVAGQLQKMHVWVTANKSICIIITLIGIIYFTVQMAKYTGAACMQIKEDGTIKDSEEMPEMTIEEQQQFKEYSQKKIQQAIIVGLIACVFNAVVSQLLNFK